MNSTAELIIARLPKSDLLTPRDIADACGYTSTDFVRLCVREGRLEGIKMAGRNSKILIARTNAIAWIREQADRED